MGEAKRRGTYEERKLLSVSARMAEHARIRALLAKEDAELTPEEIEERDGIKMRMGQYLKVMGSAGASAGHAAKEIRKVGVLMDGGPQDEPN